MWQFIQKLGKRRSEILQARHHLILTGIGQALFLKEWGEPEARILLKRVGTLCKRGSLFLTVSSDEEADCSIWIYKGKDRILFFTKKKLISHFKWSGFQAMRPSLREESNRYAVNAFSALSTSSLALVA